VKILAIILSTYFLALNFAPCDDTGNLVSEQQYEITQGSDNGDCESELCSPFCQCHCCHVHATDFKIADSNLNDPNPTSKIFSHFIESEKDFFNSILQPPQV